MKKSEGISISSFDDNEDIESMSSSNSYLTHSKIKSRNINFQEY